MSLTQERLKEKLSYCPDTGEFKWIKTIRSHIIAGKVAGGTHKNTGYSWLRVDKNLYQTHRLVWLYVHGKWPTGELDHINGVRDDNRLCNLREASRSRNCENKRKAQANNKSGFLGVCAEGKKFRADIKIKGKKLFLGCHETAEMAHQAYVNAKRQHHEGCTL